MTRSQRLVTGIRDVRWQRDVLEVDGHGFIDGVPDVGPGSTIHRLQLRLVGSKAERRHRARPAGSAVPTSPRTRRRAPCPTTAPGSSPASPPTTSRCRRARMPSSTSSSPRSPPRPPAVARWSAVPSTPAPSTRPGRGPRPASSSSPATAAARCGSPCGGRPAVVHDVEVHGEEVTLTLRAAPGHEVPEGWVHLRRLDASTGVTVPVERRDGEAVATVPAEALEVTSRSLTERSWRLWFVVAAPEDATDDGCRGAGRPARHRRGGRPSARLPAASSSRAGTSARSTSTRPPAPGRARLHGRLLRLRERGVTGGVLVDGPCRPEVTGFAFTPNGLDLHGDTGGADLDRLVLVSTADRLDVPVTTSGDTWRAHVPATGAPGGASLRWLRPGRWRVVAAAPGETDPDLGVHVSAEAEAHLGDVHDGPVRVVLRTNPAARARPGRRRPGPLERPRRLQPEARPQGALPRRAAPAPHRHRVLRGVEGPAVQRQPARRLRGARAPRRPPPARVGRRGPRGRGARRRRDGGHREPGLLPRPRPGPVGREQRLHAEALREARGLPLRPDLARHAAQAHRLRHREPPDGEQELPQAVRQGGREVGRARVPEPVLHRHLPAGLPLRRPGARDRLPAQRRLPPPRGPGRAHGRGAPPARHRAREAGHPLRADLAGQPVRPRRAATSSR